MPLDSAVALVDAIRQGHLLEPAQLDELGRDIHTRASAPRALAAELIRRGWLTPFQANQVLQGRGGELLLGSYVLLERLGEGGMGAVYKARNWKLGRIVALKVIKKERLTSEDAVRRFHREIRAAAALSHPNIVAAYDADEVNGTHFFAMECVEGSDLAKLVKQHGPMPVAQACDWIRQAAVGLQHAHERGLVHRDIKPANLLLTKQGVIKILDMGLARLSAEEGEASTTMTQEGMVMGTPDYMAPEQAEESHTVDIRADVYSLGCTLYHLLTGKVPFPGGTLIQKLKKHQSNQPAPVEALRPDVPQAVCEVVYKLLAKRPEDRYQTPAEVAAALADCAIQRPAARDSRTLTVGDPVRVASATGETVNRAFDFQATDEATEVVQAARRRSAKRRLLFAIGGGFVLLIGIAAAFAALYPRRRQQTQEAPPSTETRVEKHRAAFAAWRREVAKLPPEKQVEAVAKKLQDLNPGFDGKVTPQIDNGVVTSLKFVTDDVTRLSPVQALTGLQSLWCNGSAEYKGRLVDLSPLKDMKLTELNCADTKVFDLSPLRTMKLTSLHCFRTPVADLSPLKDLKLTGLNCSGTKVTDLSPLKEMKLTGLNCIGSPVADLSPLKGMSLSYIWLSRTQVRDLAPLQGMPLQTLYCESTPVSSLAPLTGMPLKELYCDFKAERDTAILRSLKTLETINEKPAAEFWKEVDAGTPAKTP